MSGYLPEPRQISVADIIKRLRGRKSLSARSVSLAAGYSSSYVGKLEAGEIEPSFRAFARLALVLEMNPHEVYFCILQENRSTTSPPSG